MTTERAGVAKEDYWCGQEDCPLGIIRRMMLAKKCNGPTKEVIQVHETTNGVTRVVNVESGRYVCPESPHAKGLSYKDVLG